MGDDANTWANGNRKGGTEREKCIQAISIVPALCPDRVRD